MWKVWIKRSRLCMRHELRKEIYTHVRKVFVLLFHFTFPLNCFLLMSRWWKLWGKLGKRGTYDLFEPEWKGWCQLWYNFLYQLLWYSVVGDLYRDKHESFRVKLTFLTNNKVLWSLWCKFLTRFLIKFYQHQ